MPIDLPTPALIGVVHLAPLPGSARGLLPMDEVYDRALTDARTLAAAGFDAIIVENFGDAPFHADSLPPASLAGLAIIADRLRRETGLAVGVNALRNDARAALGISVVAGASFIRVNVHTGVTATDQGLIEGRAAETLAYRRQLGSRVAVLADVHVKHGRCLNEPDLGRAAKDTAYRGLADGLIVTGPSTGAEVAMDDLEVVRNAVPDRRLFVGSGANASNIHHLLTIATGAIIGSSIKQGKDPANPIDPELAADFVRAARTR